MESTILTRRPIQEIIARQSFGSVSGNSEDDIIKSLSPFVPNFSGIVKISQSLGKAMGLKSRQQCVKIHTCTYDKAVLSYFMAVKQMELDIQTLYDTNTGSALEAKLPNDVFTLGTRLKLEIIDEASQIRVRASTEVKGQLYDWGKGSRLLNDLCEAANQYIEIIHIPGH